MSTHPNGMLLCVFTPDDLPMKTLRAIAAKWCPGKEDISDFEVKLGPEHFGESFTLSVMEEDYDEDNQISAPTGSIVASTLFTYGYGESVTWEKLVGFQKKLEEWAVVVDAEFHCTHEIRVSANYW